MAYISTEVMAEVLREKWICDVCQQPVEVVERFKDKTTMVSGLRFYCHGDRDEWEVSEKMIEFRTMYRRIKPFSRQKINADLRRLDYLGRLTPKCQKCDQPVDEVRLGFDGQRNAYPVLFRHHGEFEEHLVEKDIVLAAWWFPKAVLLSKPFSNPRKEIFTTRAEKVDSVQNQKGETVSVVYRKVYTFANGEDAIIGLRQKTGPPLRAPVNIAQPVFNNTAPPADNFTAGVDEPSSPSKSLIDFMESLIVKINPQGRERVAMKVGDGQSIKRGDMVSLDDWGNAKRAERKNRVIGVAVANEGADRTVMITLTPNAMAGSTVLDEVDGNEVQQKPEKSNLFSIGGERIISLTDE